MKVYLDIDGTLIHEDLTENYGKPAAGLEDFILALQTHELYWLTTHCREGDPTRAQEIVKRVTSPDIHRLIDDIKGTVWDVNKSEGIDWDYDLIWFDNEIFPEERARFDSVELDQQFIEVDLRSNPNQLVEITRDILI